MCVKQFLGYNCGHCSVPVMKQCPISASNPFFPVCKYPAERPIFTNEYCHACARVVWNAKVLREEEEHRDRHLQGECGCEVIFEGEEREKRVRPRPGKNKGKGKSESGEGGADRGAVAYSHGLTHQMEIPPKADLAGEAIHGATTQYGYRVQADVPSSAYFAHYQAQGEVQLANPEQSFATPVGGYDASTKQLMAGQFGAGMKWYPQENIPQRSASFPFHFAPRGHKAMSEPSQRDSEELSEDLSRYDVEEPFKPQPAIVSSEMARADPSSS